MLGRRGLLILSGLLWSVAGVNVLRKGITALVEVLSQSWSWYAAIVVLLAIAIGTGFLLMFRGVVRKYTRRIQELDGERWPFYRFMSVKGYLLIGLMMTLGISASMIPGMPEAFFASFYTGLGTGLAYGAIRFFMNSVTGDL